MAGIGGGAGAAGAPLPPHALNGGCGLLRHLRPSRLTRRRPGARFPFPGASGHGLVHGDGPRPAGGFLRGHADGRPGYRGGRGGSAGPVATDHGTVSGSADRSSSPAGSLLPDGGGMDPCATRSLDAAAGAARPAPAPTPVDQADQLRFSGRLGHGGRNMLGSGLSFQAIRNGARPAELAGLPRLVVSNGPGLAAPAGGSMRPDS